MGDVQLKGKSRKIRRCPFWSATVNVLLTLVRSRSQRINQYFSTSSVKALTRHGIPGCFASMSAKHPPPIHLCALGHRRARLLGLDWNWAMVEDERAHGPIACRDGAGEWPTPRR
jgi:hypothetical protein